MAIVIPTHTHSVVDIDRPFVINPSTKEIAAETDNLTLAQHSKDSERFTFTISGTTIEGHDMTACNSVMIHFQNIGEEFDQISIGVYKVKDLKVSNGSVTLSWLIGDEATQYAGSLIFSIHFACTAEDGTVVYNFPTLTYSKITVGATVWNSDTIAREYPDIIAEFDARIASLNAVDADDLAAVASRLEKVDGIVTNLPFEPGYAYPENNVLRYYDSPQHIRTPEGTVIHLNKGDYIEGRDSLEYDLWSIYKVEGEYVVEAAIERTEGENETERYTATVDGDYVISIYHDTTLVDGDLERIASNISIVRSSGCLTKEAVRFTEQDSTEEEKAQARANIGAARSSILIANDALSWDGNTNGRTFASNNNFVHISDIVPDFSAFANGATVELFSGEVIPIAADKIYDLDNSPGSAKCYAPERPSEDWVGAPFVVALEDNAQFGTTTLPKKGVYFRYSDDVKYQVRSLYLPGYAGFRTEKLDPELLPTPAEMGVICFVGQTLTKKQQAQARANIGACDAEILIESGDTLTWDKNTDGRAITAVSGGDSENWLYQYVHVSNVVPTMADIPGEGLTADMYADGMPMDTTILRKHITEVVPGVVMYSWGYHEFAFVSEDAVGVEIAADSVHGAGAKVTFPKAGVYFYYHDSKNFVYRLTIPGYTGFGKRLDPNLLPESVATKEFVEAAIGSAITASY